MLFLLNSTNGIPLKSIADYLNRYDIDIVSKINKKYSKYFSKYDILVKLVDYFWLIKRQRRRPVTPSLYSRLCGIDLWINNRPTHTIMDKYKKTRMYIKNLSKFQHPLSYNNGINDCLYRFDSILLIDEDITRIFNIISTGFTPKTYMTLNYYNQLYNYESLGVSATKANILSSFNHDFYYYKNNFSNPNPSMNREWSEYQQWKEKNKQFSI